MLCTFRHASSPPLAATFFSTICAALSSGSACNWSAYTAVATQTTLTHIESLLMASLRARTRRTGHGQLRFGEQSVFQRRIDHHLLDIQLVRLCVAFDDGFKHMRDLQPLLGLVVAIEDRDVAQLAIHLSGVTVNFPLQETG